MRRALIALFTVGLLASGSAFAQGTHSNMFAGVSAGYSTSGWLSGSVFPIGITFGIDDVGVQNLAVRGDAELMVLAPGLRFGVDALYRYPVMADLFLYGGLGPSLFIGFSGLSGYTSIGLRISGGAEYMLTPYIGVTGEANATPYFTHGSPFMFGFSVGVDYHF